MTGRHGREVAAALLLDAAYGEPPEAAHPIVWIGTAISAVERRALKLKDPTVRRLAGVLLAGALPALVLLSSRWFLGRLPRSIRVPVEVALLSTTLSMRGLASAARKVERELEAGQLTEARARVGEFVGRDTATLPETDVCRAAVESVAENTSDGVTAPILYGSLFGVPGALAYKTVNTLDSMVGYKTGAYRELGWASARLDDLTNIAPSRLTAGAVAIVSLRPVQTLTTAVRYGPLTSSPNAGWAEAAFAGALGVRLGGANTYGGVVRDGPELGGGRRPESGDIGRAVALMRRGCVLVSLAALFIGETRRG